MKVFRALLDVGEPAVPALLRLCRIKENGRLNQLAIEAVSQIVCSESVRGLKNLLSESADDVNNFRALCKALLALGTRESLAAVIAVAAAYPRVVGEVLLAAEAGLSSQAALAYRTYTEPPRSRKSSEEELGSQAASEARAGQILLSAVDVVQTEAAARAVLAAATEGFGPCQRWDDYELQILHEVILTDWKRDDYDGRMLQVWRRSNFRTEKRKLFTTLDEWKKIVPIYRSLFQRIGPVGIPVLVEALGHVSEAARKLARLSLQDIGWQTCEPEERARWLVADFQFGKAAAEYPEALAVALGDPDSNPTENELEALMALGESGNSRAEPVLQAYLESVKSHTRYRRRGWTGENDADAWKEGSFVPSHGAWVDYRIHVTEEQLQRLKRNIG